MFLMTGNNREKSADNKAARSYCISYNYNRHSFVRIHIVNDTITLTSDTVHSKITSLVKNNVL